MAGVLAGARGMFMPVHVASYQASTSGDAAGHLSLTDSLHAVAWGKQLPDGLSLKDAVAGIAQLLVL